MECAYKFRLYPNRAQETQINKTFGCSRYVFNHYLAQRQETYKATGKAPTRFQQCNDLTILKQELEWLCEADSKALQNAIADLDRAFQNFFRRVKKGEKPGYPKFKSKYDHRRSYRTTGSIAVGENKVKLPKLGWVKCAVSRAVQGRILNATVSCEPTGKFFVSLC